jgi:penicillin-binding protein 1C
MRASRFIRLMIVFCLLLAGLIVAGYFYLMIDLPSIESWQANQQLPSVRIIDRNGRLLYELLPDQGGRHAVIPLEQIPIALRQATIATEDRSFYYHPGVDIVGVIRAAWINLQGRQSVVGGSTITQQVARNLLLNPEERGQRSIRRKLREMILAWRLTRQLSKDEVLAIYLNQTYYGGMAYGVEAASETFFAKPVSELDLAECALLAGLPQAPARYNPFTDFEAATKRQEVVLGLMEEDGYISSEEHFLAKRERLVLAEMPYPVEAPHFVMMVRSQLDELFAPQDIIAHGGLVVNTTLDLDWQKHAEAAIQHNLDLLKHSPDGFGHNVNNAALVALDPNSGEVLALVGSPDYFDPIHAGAINMAAAPRQPGSALKPLVYAVALDPARASKPWTAATMILDVRTSFVTHEGQAYIPENYDLREHGPVLVREALASSLNIPAVITLNHIGIKALFDLASRLGISTLQDPDTYDLSLALGGGEVRLIDLTAAYAAFANTGFRVSPKFIINVTDVQGRVLYTPPPESQVRVLDERVAWLISDILSDNDARRVGFGANSVLRLDRPAAVKTGTTSNFHDNWTIGYTPDLVVGVWSGNTDYESMRGVNGLSGAAPIWHQFIRTVLESQPERGFVQPQGFVRMEVCAISGLLPTDTCPYRRSEWFIDGTQPDQPDHFYRQVVVDAITGRLADASTPISQRVRQTVLDLPPQAQPWAKSQGLLLFSDLRNPDSSSNGNEKETTPVSIISPAMGSVFILAAGYSQDSQRILFEAIGEPGLSQLVIYVDGKPLASFSAAPFKAWWTLTPGEHKAWVSAIRLNGERIQSEVITFTVKS